MTPKSHAATLAMAALLVAGCQQHEKTAQTNAVPPPVQMSATDTATSQSQDPSLPDAENALRAKPGQDAGATLSPPTAPAPAPAAETGRDATRDSALTPAERDREMPMKGQANDYNTPDRAKEGDQPNTASKEPGGQEANPGNLTRDAKENTQ